MLYSERKSGLVCFSKDRINKRLNQVIVYIIPTKFLSNTSQTLPTLQLPQNGSNTKSPIFEDCNKGRVIICFGGGI